MFLTIKRSNISYRLTPLIYTRQCPAKGMALPCPDAMKARPKLAPKRRLAKGGLSACKRHPFRL